MSLMQINICYHLEVLTKPAIKKLENYGILAHRPIIQFYCGASFATVSLNLWYKR
jgi:hypothetical protein